MSSVMKLMRLEASDGMVSSNIGETGTALHGLRGGWGGEEGGVGG